METVCKTLCTTRPNKDIFPLTQYRLSLGECNNGRCLDMIARLEYKSVKSDRRI